MQCSVSPDVICMKLYSPVEHYAIQTEQACRLCIQQNTVYSAMHLIIRSLTLRLKELDKLLKIEAKHSSLNQPSPVNNIQIHLTSLLWDILNVALSDASTPLFLKPIKVCTFIWELTDNKFEVFSSTILYRLSYNRLVRNTSPSYIHWVTFSIKYSLLLKTSLLRVLF